jgi:histone H3/H4
MSGSVRSKRNPPSIFGAEAWSSLLSELTDDEQLTRDASSLMDSIGLALLTGLARYAAESAQRRGAKSVEREDVQFALETILPERQKPPPALTPNARHKQRMRLVQQLQEGQD